MVLDFSVLNNITPPNVNTTIFENSSNLVLNIAQNADSFTLGWYGIFLMFALYLFSLYELNKSQGLFKLDFVRASVISSFISLVIGSVMVVSNLLNSFYVIIWIGIIFLISLFGSYYQKQKGL